MALIEGVGDEVTVLFGLVFILLVLVLSWASTHTIDRSDQAQQLADGSPVELQDPACPFSTEASAQPAASETATIEPGCTAESQRDGAEGEIESQRDGAEGEMEKGEMESQRDGAEGEMDSQRDGAEGEMESQRGGVEGEIESQRGGVEGEMESQRGDGEGQGDQEEQEWQRDQGQEQRNRSEGQGQRDRVEVERQEKEKRNDIEEQVVPEPEEAWPTVSATEDLVSDPVPVQLRQRLTTARGRDAAETQAIGGHLPHSDCAQDSSMVMRLKFLNDTERIVQVRPEHTIGHIKRTQFPHQEHQVRLIYQGQLLRDDTQTLSSLHITGNCVVHCHISQNATPQSPAGSHAAENTDTTLNIGGLMLPLFLLMLSILWYYQINYRHFFTPPATISLVGITILFSFVAFGAYRR
ncbi:transmembrane and ubiquitin-like domain-containing protein 1 [Hemitrygon akajei]|uniref:transmembrane and ubiquitin-like domain-containing protein 1 n=1 Tax=Hemitrygon akajei TaxID=2704970 RepID=UPI003BF94532